jgi:hypothetical protein
MASPPQTGASQRIGPWGAQISTAITKGIVVNAVTAAALRAIAAIVTLPK